MVSSMQWTGGTSKKGRAISREAKAHEQRGAIQGGTGGAKEFYALSPRGPGGYHPHRLEVFPATTMGVYREGELNLLTPIRN